MIDKTRIMALLISGLMSHLVLADTNNPKTQDLVHNSQTQRAKPIIYQVFTRLFGNQNTTNKPWGTSNENGVGKFNDFTPKALAGIKELGISHIWYTGVPHHALAADYTDYGISLDDPDVIKGRAGSPYAVKDYYNVNPDLAVQPDKRLAEFEALIERTHAHGMKVIIDIVPNHVARNYESLNLPEGETNFGATDNKELAYNRDNNFYYITGESFEVPDNISVAPNSQHPLLDGKFIETPAKWTGNGSQSAKPNVHDWYETVKVNYGVKPDGTYDFPRLDSQYRDKGYAEHFQFWIDKDVPDSWKKFRGIAEYWLEKGVDGFRYDMAEMVPVEFWSYLNSAIKTVNPNALLLAEVYQPHLYRDYLQLGKMDYLYDKVGFYDTVKAVMQAKRNVQGLHNDQASIQDISGHMLRFLENHDEQRIASPPFAGNALKGKPALVASALSSSAPFMLYFGQDVGEDGSEETGFGDPTSTSIFDYFGVPEHQKWMNKGAFDGGALAPWQRDLRQYYIEVMRLAAHHPAMLGSYSPVAIDDEVYGFIRKANNTWLLVISNFSDDAKKSINFNWLPRNRSDTNINFQTSVLLDDSISINAKALQSGSVSAMLAPMGSLVIEVNFNAD